MNFSQKLGLFILILISVAYVYFSFFSKEGIHFNPISNNETPNYELEDLPSNINNVEPPVEIKPEADVKTVKIFISDSNGNLRSVNRKCDTSVEKSCFEYSIKELISAPSKWEKSKGFTSEVPQGTKILSVRESADNIIIDLSSNFEGGGGTESTYRRIKQVIKTANANTKLPVYLYINGKQANVIGGEGIMIKQPLNERSLDE